MQSSISRGQPMIFILILALHIVMVGCFGVFLCDVIITWEDVHGSF